MHRNFGPTNAFDLESFSDNITNKKYDNSKLFVNSSIFSNADGSAYVEYGDTKVVCTVYSPIELKSEEQLSVTIRYAPFSQKSRLNYVNNTDTRISKFIQSSLQSAIDFSNHAHSKIEVYLLVLNDDGNAISAMVTCASLALINAKVAMYDILVGVNLISHASQPTSDDTKQQQRINQTISVAVMPNMRQIANLMSTSRQSLAEYGDLLKWDGPLKEALHMYEIVKLHLHKTAVKND